LRSLAPKAVRVLGEALDGAESVSAAIHILKILGFPGTPLTPSGSSDARILSAQMAEQENTAAVATEEVVIAAKRKSYMRAMDDLQYNLS
jgi:hypothetical protein